MPRRPRITKQVSPNDFVEWLVGGLPGQPDVIPGSRLHICSRCLRQTIIAPSGLKRLTQFPDTKLICLDCFAKMPEDKETYTPDLATLLGDLSGMSNS